MHPEAHVVFLGVMLPRDRMAALQHRAEAAWATFWSIKKHPTTKAIPARSRLLRLKVEMGPEFCWGFSLLGI